MSIDRLLSKPEFYYWYLIPTVVGLTVLIWTVKQISKKADNKNIFLTIIIFLLIGLSQWVLIQIFFFDAWPTFFPHFATFLSCLLVLLLYYLNRKDRVLNK